MDESNSRQIAAKLVKRWSVLFHGDPTEKTMREDIAEAIHDAFQAGREYEKPELLEDDEPYTGISFLASLAASAPVSNIRGRRISGSPYARPGSFRRPQRETQ